MHDKIPCTMATQHPDNASSVYWLGVGKSYVNAQDEIEETYRCFFDMHCQEYLWDWEGKNVDESVAEKLLEKHAHFFKTRSLGEDVKLSLRLPNIWKEKGYRIAKAFVSILSANDFAGQLGFHTPPVFETYLPMTDSARKLLFIQKKYGQIAYAFQALKPSGPKAITVTPLVEEIPLMANAGKIALDYISLHKKVLGKPFKEEKMRFWLARSDPALNSGFAASVIGVKLGLSSLQEFSEKSSIQTFPIIGAGCLPFRGGLGPDSVKDFSKEYSGVRTVTVQSAFRYDYPLPKVKKAVNWLNSNLKGKTKVYDQQQKAKAMKIIAVFEEEYRKTVEAIAEDVNKISKHVPARRERRQHVGLFGYSRMLGKKSLPRAISFVAAMYSIGVPPELIGTGRALKRLEKMGLADEAQDFCVNLKKDLVNASNYLNSENLSYLSQKKKAWQTIVQDVRALEDFLGIGLGPQTDDHFIHRNITSNVRLLMKKGESPKEEIQRAGEIRKSLG